MRRTLLLLALMAHQAAALPEGPVVNHGQVQINPQGNVMQILQASPQAIVNWNSFNIRADELVQFLQSSNSAILLNRVVGQNPSEILGRLTANGKIYLVNPNGILFGPGSVVDAGSFVASTLNISDRDFLNQRFQFKQDQAGLAAIVNQGTLKVADGGYLVLLSPLIHNDGLIVARQGEVALGATRQATLNFDGQNLLEIAVPQAGQAGTVLLTPGQMSDALSQVVSPGAQEANSLEGVLLNTGQIQGHQARLDSTQATLTTGVIQAGDVRLLSRGTTVDNGRIEGDFVEISGRSVGLYQPVKAGTLLLDPQRLDVISTAPGTADPALPNVLSGNANTTVSAQAISAQSGNVILQATDVIDFNPGAHVNFASPANLTVTAGNTIQMEANSSITGGATSSLTFQAGQVTMDPGSSVNIGTFTVNATNADLTDVRVSNLTSHTDQGTRFLDGTWGRPGADLHWNVSTGTDFLVFAGSNVNVVGNNAHVNVTAGNSIGFFDASNVTFQTTSNNLTFDAGQNFFTSANTRFSLSGPSNVRFHGSGNDAGIGANATLTNAAALNLTIDAGHDAILFPSAHIRANGPLNLTMQAGNDVRIRDHADILTAAPANITLRAGRDVTAEPGTALTANAATNLRGDAGRDIFLGPNMTVTANATTNIVLNATNDAGLQSGTSIRANAPLNLTLTAGNDAGMVANSTVTGTAPLNVSLNAGRTAYLQDGVTISDDAETHVAMNATGSALMFSNTHIVSNNAASTVTLNAQTGEVDMVDIRVPTISATAQTFVLAAGGQWGQPTHPTHVTIAAPQFLTFTSATTNVVGTLADVNISTTGDFFLGSLSQLNVDADTANVRLHTDSSFVVLSNAQVRVNAGASNFTMDAGNNLSTGDGMAIALNGGHTNADFHAGNILQTGLNSTIDINTTTANVVFSSGTNIQMGTNTVIQAAHPVNMTFDAGTQFRTRDSHIFAPAAGSNVSVTAPDVIRIGEMESGGRLSFQAGSNITIFDHASAADLFLSTPATILGQVGNGTAELAASNSLTIQTGQIYGNLTSPLLGVSDALTFATGPTTNTSITVSGANESTIGDRAGSLYYRFPQSSNFQLTRSPGAGLVSLVREPDPNPPPPPQPPTPEQPFRGREDLQPGQLQELTQATAQSNPQLGNKPPSTTNPSAQGLTLLNHRSESLLGFSVVSPTEVLIEGPASDVATVTDEQTVAFAVHAYERSSGEPRVETATLMPAESQGRVEARETEVRQAVSATLETIYDDNSETAELRFWRRLLRGLILWEDDLEP